MKRITLSLMFKDTAICTAKLCLIKSITKLFSSLSYFFIHFIVVLSQLVFDKYVCTITFFRIFVINQWVIECINVSGSLPDSGVHKDCRVNAYNILVQQYHAVPPVFLNIIFEFNSHLAVVVYSSQSVVNIT